jgi:hypothetical protein
VRIASTLLLLTTLACITFPTVARAEPKGFWCWTHPDGAPALCARQQDQCEASLRGFNETAKAFGEPQIPAPCKWQKTTWELVTKRPRGPGHHYPTKKLCVKARDTGDTCRQSR